LWVVDQRHRGCPDASGLKQVTLANVRRLLLPTEPQSSFLHVSHLSALDRAAPVFCTPSRVLLARTCVPCSLPRLSSTRPQSDGKTCRTLIRRMAWMHVLQGGLYNDIGFSEVKTRNLNRKMFVSYRCVEMLTPTLPSVPPFTSHAKPCISTTMPVVTLKDVLVFDFPLLNINNRR
jgi:hypothetical protein